MIDEDQQPVLVSTATRSWLRPRRTEPFAACCSVGPTALSLEALLHSMEQTFREASRYSVTSSLSRALLAAHASLAQDNTPSSAEHRHYATVIVAAARP